MANIVIREVTAGDAEGIATLMSELGYPTSPDQMQRRLAAIFHDKDYDTFAAFNGADIVGFAGARSGHLYEDDALYGQVMTLVVAPALRRGGVGRLLIRAVEARTPRSRREDPCRRIWQPTG